MRKILVVGYGNPMRGDDGLGPAAVGLLERRMHEEGVRFLVRHQLGIELAADLSEADLAIFIDAHVGDVAGTIKEEMVVPDVSVPGSFSHHLRPGILIGMIEALYNRHPETVIYSISAGSFDHGKGLSPAVEAAMPALADCVLARIAAFRAKDKK